MCNKIGVMWIWNWYILFDVFCYNIKWYYHLIIQIKYNMRMNQNCNLPLWENIILYIYTNILLFGKISENSKFWYLPLSSRWKLLSTGNRSEYIAYRGTLQIGVTNNGSYTVLIWLEEAATSRYGEEASSWRARQSIGWICRTKWR